MGKNVFTRFSVNSCSAEGIWSWRAYWILLLFLANDSQQTLRNQSPLISSLCLEGDQQAQRNWSQSKAFYLNAQSLVVFGILRHEDPHNVAGHIIGTNNARSKRHNFAWCLMASNQQSLLNTSKVQDTGSVNKDGKLISRPWHRPTICTFKVEPLHKARKDDPWCAKLLVANEETTSAWVL